MKIYIQLFGQKSKQAKKLYFALGRMYEENNDNNLAIQYFKKITKFKGKDDTFDVMIAYK